MKWISAILAVYLLLLSAVPCCSVDDCTEEKSEWQAGQDAKHDKEEDDCGTCSPFFSCEGCVAAGLTSQSVYFEFTALPAKPVYTRYLQVSLPGSSDEFWQPPRRV